MRRLVMLITLGLACVLHAGTVARLIWQVETSRPLTRDWPLVYGETVDLECQYTSYATPMCLTGSTVVLHARTNNMAAGLSYQATGTVGRVNSPAEGSNGWVTVRIDVDRVLPADQTVMTYTIDTALSGARMLRASGTFTLSGTSAGLSSAPAPAAYDPVGSAAAAQTGAVAQANIALTNEAAIRAAADTALGLYIDATTNGAARGVTALQVETDPTTTNLLDLAGSRAMTGDSVTLARDVVGRDSGSVGAYSASFGFDNLVGGASLCGGGYNTIGDYSLAAGTGITLGDYSFGAGFRGKAGTGAFVFSDSLNADFDRSAYTNAFSVRASGGAHIATPMMTVTGGVTAASFHGSGAALTGINASQITNALTPVDVTNIVSQYAAPSFPVYDWGTHTNVTMVLSNSVLYLF